MDDIEMASPLEELTFLVDHDEWTDAARLLKVMADGRSVVNVPTGDMSDAQARRLAATAGGFLVHSHDGYWYFEAVSGQPDFAGLETAARAAGSLINLDNSLACPKCNCTPWVSRVAGEEPYEARCQCRYASGGTENAALTNWRADTRRAFAKR